MEFGKKIQQLRQQKGLTQQQLAAALFVSRAAVSRWEAGRGYPNIDSLKDIAAFFSLSVDELLSSEQLLSVAQNEQKHRHLRLCNLVFGLLDTAALLPCFLPLFAQKNGERVNAVSLFSLNTVHPLIKTAYFVLLAALILSGLLHLALLNSDHKIQQSQMIGKISLILNAVGVILLIAGRQVYVAVLLVVILIIKLLVKRT